jgi:DNA-binding MarR family transcriptional regulator
MDLNVKHARLHRARRNGTMKHMKKLAKGRSRPAALPEAATVEEFLCFSVYSVSHAFNRVYQPLLKEFGLTYPQFIALVALWEEGERTVGELGRKLFLQSNTLTPMLKRLEQLGYINRARDAEDERQVRISLTDSGRKLRSSLSGIVQSVRSAVSLKDEQVATMIAQLDVLRKGLEARQGSRGT